MTGGERARFAGLLAVSAVLAVYELFFLPLRLDGLVLPDVGALPFPVTALVAALTLPWLTGRAAAISPRVPVAGGPLFAWLGTLLVLMVVAPGGDMMIMADWRTLLLLAGGGLPAAVRLGDLIARHTQQRAAAQAAARAPRPAPGPAVGQTAPRPGRRPRRGSVQAKGGKRG